MSQKVIKTRQLNIDEIEALKSDGFHRTLCDCRNQLFVWPNTNLKECYQVRCRVCDNNVSYIVKWNKRTNQAFVTAFECPTVEECYKRKRAKALADNELLHQKLRFT